MSEVTSTPLVRIDRLSVRLPKGGDRPFAVENISFHVDPGEIVCVVGESGSGKSVAASTLMGLCPMACPLPQAR